ncbi:MAG: TlpA disulfide reductase family protein [Opitutaceae bacterium]|nr:TlpA disulfide reductase family protein [Opitutaceae bacterium]
MSPLNRIIRLASLLALIAAAPAAAAIKVGDVFPPIAEPGVTGLRGMTVPGTAGKVVLVDFWASWCAPCKASFPAMAKLHAAYAARGLVIVAVSIDEKAPAAEAFAKKLAPPFATLHDRQQKLAKQVVVPAMPTSYLLGPDGRVRFIHQGYRGEPTERELRAHIELLLAELSPPLSP